MFAALLTVTELPVVTPSELVATAVLFVRPRTKSVLPPYAAPKLLPVAMVCDLDHMELIVVAPVFVTVMLAPAPGLLGLMSELELSPENCVCGSADISHEIIRVRSSQCEEL
jgi:hypothetical protein